jgi:excisionase family DNA binding protein
MPPALEPNGSHGRPFDAGPGSRQEHATMALTRLYTVPEAAEALKVTEAAIRRWIWQRRLAVVKIGSAVRIEEAELTRLIEVGRQPRWPSLRPPRSATGAGRPA